MGWVRKGALLAALAGSAYLGLRWGPALAVRVEGLLDGAGSGGAPADADARGPTVSPELADATLDRFERFRSGEGGERLALGSTELTSLLRFALPGVVPLGIADPSVTLDSGRVRLGARIAVEAFPRMPRLDDVMGLLPDTVLLVMEGVLAPLDQSFLALRVDRVEASRIPIPSRLVADVLAGLGRKGPASLPADALAVPIPDGVGTVFVQGDSLVLQARR